MASRMNLCRSSTEFEVFPKFEKKTEMKESIFFYFYCTGAKKEEMLAFSKWTQKELTKPFHKRNNQDTYRKQ